MQVQSEGESRPLYSLPNLDIRYLMKSSLAISAEIEQYALLKKIKQVVIESSGAQHGFLLVTDDGVLFAFYYNTIFPIASSGHQKSFASYSFQLFPSLKKQVTD